MKREDLKSLELSDDAINKIMEWNGKDIEREKGKAQAYERSNNALNDQLVIAQKVEKEVRKAFGLADDAQIDSVADMIDGVKKGTLDTANKRLIMAELKATQGYDHKLLSKLADLSTVSVNDDGTITGLKEVIEATEKEYPAVKLASEVKQELTAKPLVPPNPPAGESAKGTDTPKGLGSLITSHYEKILAK